MSFSTEITPDILVWCSKTYPKHNDGRPRLEAYVCEPMQEDDGATSGVRERGKAIEATKKHTTKIENGNVLDWLENTYPYSVVNRRKNPNAKGDTDTSSTNVHDEIISYYSEHLLDKNIALW